MEIPIELIDDSVDNPNRTIEYRIDGPDWLMLQPATGTLTIIDDELPTVAITARPPALGRSATAAVSFSGSAGAVSFQCSHNGSAWQACASPRQFAGLASRLHTLRVRAVDDNGDRSVVRQAQWRTDRIAPGITRQVPRPNGAVRAGQRVPVRALVRDRGGATPAVRRVQMRINGRQVRIRRASDGRIEHRTGRLRRGRYTVQVIAQDAAGNRSQARWRFVAR